MDYVGYACASLTACGLTVAIDDIPLSDITLICGFVPDTAQTIQLAKHQLDRRYCERALGLHNIVTTCPTAQRHVMAVLVGSHIRAERVRAGFAFRLDAILYCGRNCGGGGIDLSGLKNGVVCGHERREQENQTSV